MRFARIPILLIAGSLALWSAPASSEIDPRTLQLIRDALSHTPDVKNGAALYGKHCSGCHGAKAWGDGQQAVPALAGQREPYLLAQLIRFASRHRVSPEMLGVLSQPELERPQVWRDIAAYLSARKPNPRPEHGDAASLELGENVYKKTCARCHGARGEGRSEEPMPALRAQHYPYLLVQMRDFAAGHRSDVEPAVTDLVAGLSTEQIAAVADYLSRLPAQSR